MLSATIPIRFVGASEVSESPARALTRFGRGSCQVESRSLKPGSGSLETHAVGVESGQSTNPKRDTQSIYELIVGSWTYSHT
jgi:hypothetical protein